MALLVRDEHGPPLLSDNVRRQVMDRLRHDVATAMAAQAPEGYWTLDWIRGTPPRPGILNTDFWRLVVTGHMLEFMEYLPLQLQPRDAVYRLAATWLEARLKTGGKELSSQDFCPWTHAACAVNNLVEP
jgi:hypothetical protein